MLGVIFSIQIKSLKHNKKNKRLDTKILVPSTSLLTYNECMNRDWIFGMMIDCKELIADYAIYLYKFHAINS
jgi:hypothetical protein